MFDDRECAPRRPAHPAPPTGAPRVDTGSPRIWIRIDGTWYVGDIQRWFRLPGGRWDCWLADQADPDHPTVAPVWGNFAYDPETILDLEWWPEPPRDSTT